MNSRGSVNVTTDDDAYNADDAVMGQAVDVLREQFQTIPGTTRSGGRWPSSKVLMFMMTFSPI